MKTLNDVWPKAQIHATLYSKLHFGTHLEKSRCLHSIDYCHHARGDADNFTQHVRKLLTGHATVRRLRLTFDFRPISMRSPPLPWFRFNAGEHLPPLEELVLERYPFNSHPGHLSEWTVALDPSNLTLLHIKECGRDLDFIRTLNNRIPLLRSFSYGRWWVPPGAHLSKASITGRIIDLLSTVERLTSLSLHGNCCSISLGTISRICPHLISLSLHGDVSGVPDKPTVQELRLFVGSLPSLEVLTLDSHIEVMSRPICETDISEAECEFLRALAAAPKLHHVGLYDNARLDLPPQTRIGVPYDSMKTFKTTIGRKIFEYLQSVKVGAPLKRLDLDAGWFCEQDIFPAWDNRHQISIPPPPTSRSTHELVQREDGSSEIVASWFGKR